MTIERIKWENTEVIQDGDKAWYTNPEVDVSVSTNGEVKSLRSGKLLKMNGLGQFSVMFSGNVSTHPVAFETLLGRMLGIVKPTPRSKIFTEGPEGWVKGNIFCVCKGVKSAPEVKFFGSAQPQAQSKTTAEKSQEVVEDKTVQEVTAGEGLFSFHKGGSVWVTEDFAEFPTKELADWHQNTVDKGKNNASIVLSYNGGYALAQEIYSQDVIYRGEKPYQHFVDVMNNNNGVVEKKSETYCKFDKEGLRSFGVDPEKKYTIAQAGKIEYLILAIESLENQLKEVL